MSCLGMCLAEAGPVAENRLESVGDQDIVRGCFA